MEEDRQVRRFVYKAVRRGDRHSGKSRGSNLQLTEVRGRKSEVEIFFKIKDERELFKDKKTKT